MERNVAKPLRSSHSVHKENENSYDFKIQLKIVVENEWAKISTNTLEKKNQKGRKENQEREVLPRVVGNSNL